MVINGEKKVILTNYLKLIIQTQFPKQKGFDSYLALKGIMWDDKKYFFNAVEESISGIAELSDDDELKQTFKNVRRILKCMF